MGLTFRKRVTTDDYLRAPAQSKLLQQRPSQPPWFIGDDSPRNAAGFEAPESLQNPFIYLRFDRQSAPIDFKKSLPQHVESIFACLGEGETHQRSCAV